MNVEFNGGVHFFYFRWETPFLGKFGPKNQNCQFQLKFGTKTNSNMQSPMVVFTFCVLDWKHPFWANLVQKLNIVSLSWNLVSILIRICRIQFCLHCLYFRMETPFLGRFGPKNQNCQFKLKFGTYTNSNMQNSAVQKIKIVRLSWNLVPRLIWTCRTQWWCSLFSVLYWKHPFW